MDTEITETQEETTEYTIGFSINEGLPYGYSVSFSPETKQELLNFVQSINTAALEFYNQYDKEKTLQEYITELRHIGSVMSYRLACHQEGHMELEEEQYHNDMTLFCAAVFTLYQLGVFPGFQPGGLVIAKCVIEDFAALVPTFISIETIKEITKKENS